MADLLATLLFIPYPEGEIPSGAAGEIICRFWVSDFLLWYSFTASSFNLVLITLERYYAIVQPVKHLAMFTFNKAKLLLLLVWLIALLPELFNLFVFAYQDGGCTVKWPSTGILKGTLGVWIFLTQYSIPLSIMIFAYHRILNVLKKRKIISQKDLTGNIKSSFKNVVKMLCVVAILFGVLWAPNQITFLLYNFGVEQPYHYTADATHLLAFCNSCVNPFVYGFSNPQFRKAFKKLISCNNQVVPASTAVSLHLPSQHIQTPSCTDVPQSEI
ncbi:galanin receptor type 1-like [Glandiceps talaboti]